MSRINREDMLELTRRMTPSRNCFHRIAGAYFDREGYVEGTFNIHFQKLSAGELQKKLRIARAIPFSAPNTELVEYHFQAAARGARSVWQFLNGLLDSDLKNDALLDIFYEMFGERYRAEEPYGVFFYLGRYDIPRIGTDKAEQWESEDVYRFVICAVCPVDGAYEPDKPACGFLYPAYKDRGGAPDDVDVFGAQAHPELAAILGVEQNETGKRHGGG